MKTAAILGFATALATLTSAGSYHGDYYKNMTTYTTTITKPYHSKNYTTKTTTYCPSSSITYYPPHGNHTKSYPHGNYTTYIDTSAYATPTGPTATSSQSLIPTAGATSNKAVGALAVVGVAIAYMF
ncbi:hypothetical protein B0H63DRAFT_454432 [Podospora didyma]|uniref:Uncharacterized protein n=1 Tax=Podospora didyma TaxID=330526 RepID=A0AAE0K537_9PEZI|nr:hypothetical protein B0H63DRAFT_454432 [Podospora didyma]